MSFNGIFIILFFFLVAFYILKKNKSFMVFFSNNSKIFKNKNLIVVFFSSYCDETVYTLDLCYNLEISRGSSPISNNFTAFYKKSCHKQKDYEI